MRLQNAPTLSPSQAESSACQISSYGICSNISDSVNGEIAPDPNSISRSSTDTSRRSSRAHASAVCRARTAGDATMRVGGRRSDATYRPSSSAWR